MVTWSMLHTHVLRSSYDLFYRKLLFHLRVLKLIYDIRVEYVPHRHRKHRIFHINSCLLHLIRLLSHRVSKLDLLVLNQVKHLHLLLNLIYPLTLSVLFLSLLSYDVILITDPCNPSSFLL